MLIAGGTGLIGTALQEAARQLSWEVDILSRQVGPGNIHWNPDTHQIDINSPITYDVIVNLAGVPIAGQRWTVSRKTAIQNSRVEAAATIEKYLRSGLLQTSLYIGASAIGIYGDHGQEVVDELTPIAQGDDWMVRTVVNWENAHHKIEALHIRVAIFRIGLVLSRKGGALKEMLMTAPFGFLGVFGSGKQYWSWIHIDDLVNAMMMAIEKPEMKGIFLAVAPHPVPNRMLTKEVSKGHKPPRILLPVPRIGLSLVLGKMHMMLFQSLNGHPTRLLGQGYVFKYPNLDQAIKDLFKK